MLSRPNTLKGMRHVALFVHDLEACERFYVDFLGYQVEWRPDSDNVYLCSGCDNLALHRREKKQLDATEQRLDHIGLIVDEMDHVDQWYRYLESQGVKMRNSPKTHRDGARSFYFYDPDGTSVQLIYHPPIVGKLR